MRKLTLDEKIHFKGLFQNKGIEQVAWLDMASTLHWCYVCFGCSPCRTYKFRFSKKAIREGRV